MSFLNYDIIICLCKRFFPCKNKKYCVEKVFDGSDSVTDNISYFCTYTVNAEIASDMFNENPHKSQQVKSIAKKSKTGFSVDLYRLGDHVDISSGPLIASTSFINHFSVTAVSEKYQCSPQN